MKYHTTKDGRKIRLTDLETSPLENIIKQQAKNLHQACVEIVEKYLNENMWFDHIYENGYPTKAMAKATFLVMLNELKIKIANGNGA
jgi:hypothetical protein